MSASLWLRAYAGATGIALMGLGAAGFLFLPGQSLTGSLFQVLVGALFVYAGLGQRDPVVARRFVGGMGVLLLLGAGATVFFGLLLGGVTGVLGPVQASCLVVGIASVLVARRAEPGVLLGTVSAFGSTVVAAAAVGHFRRRRRRRVAPAEEPVARPAEGCREDLGGKRPV